MLSPLDWLDAVALRIATVINTDLISMRLIMSVFLGYPVALLYAVRHKSWSIQQRQSYLLLCGVFLFLWNFGFEIIHIFLGIFTTMVANYLLFRSKWSVLFTFIFNMTYLLVGSYICNRGTYDINWTTPYCVLCLRLIGLSWDIYDASKPESEQSAYQKKSALSTFPGVLETLSFCFVPTSFICGPQFPMRHYRAFIEGYLRPPIVLHNRTFMQRFVRNVKVHRTLTRLVTGVLGIILLSLMQSRFPAELMVTTEFLQEWNLLKKIGYMTVFSQITLFRYVSVWLIGEGSCVLLGLGCTGFVHIHLPEHDGEAKEKSNTKRVNAELRTKSILERKDSAVEWNQLYADGVPKYDPAQVEIREADHTACANISLGYLILATTTDHLVAGFNINTNKWMLEYVYKRLRFLGNKSLSQICTLMFLALWHGTYTGYFVNFGLEFVTIMVEKDLCSIMRRSKYDKFFFHSKIGFVVLSILGKLHVLFMLATPMVSFYLLGFDRWFPVLKSTYFIGLVYFIWPIFRPLVKLALPPARNSVPSEAPTTSSRPSNGPNTTKEAEEMTKKSD